MLFIQRNLSPPFCFWFSNVPIWKATLHFPLVPLDSLLAFFCLECSLSRRFQSRVAFRAGLYFHLHLFSQLDPHLHLLVFCIYIQVWMQVRSEKCQVRSEKMRSKQKQAAETWSPSNSMPLCDRSNSTLSFEFSERCISSFSFYFLLVLLSCTSPSQHLTDSHIPFILNTYPVKVAHGNAPLSSAHSHSHSWTRGVL